MLTASDLAKKIGTKVRIIRHYEQIGLMSELGRTEEGHRRYGVAELDRLSFIRRSHQLGFSLAANRELLDLSDHPNRPGREADAMARRETSQSPMLDF